MFMRFLIVLILNFVCISLFGQSNTFPASGKVGIGTLNPETQLHVKGIVTSSGVQFIEDQIYTGFLGRGHLFTGGWASHPDILALTYSSRDFAIGGWSKATGLWAGAALYINSDNGNIGIGTTEPQNYKLAVAGNMIAESVKVKPRNAWPDYVFQTLYKMPGLLDLEKFIKKNKHLPNIPSAEEVEKNGIDLGELDAKLLAKIEELTLYLIEKEKQLNRQEMIITNMNQRLKNMEKIVSEKK